MPINRKRRVGLPVAAAVGIAVFAGLVGAAPANALYGQTDATPGQFPYFADFPGLCGGALIDPEWVATAAHCVPYVNLGDEVRVGWTSDTAGAGITSHAREIVKYPNDLDIALVRIDAIPNARPIAIADSPVKPGDTIVSVAAGIGSEGHLGSGTLTVSHVDSQIVAEGTTRSIYNCSGDSGSGQVVETANGPRLVGILWGVTGNCSFPTDPHGSVSVSTTDPEVRSWITSVIGTPDPGNPASFAASHPGYYEIRNVGTGLALDVSGGSVESGANIIQWPFTNGSNQRWSFADVNGSTVLKPQSSGSPLGLKGDAYVVGQPAAQVSASGAPEQGWSFEPTSDGHYTIVNKKSAQVLAISGASTQPGTQAIQWPFTGGADQKWDLIKVG